MSDNAWGTPASAEGPDGQFAPSSFDNGGQPAAGAPFADPAATTMTPEQLAYQRGQRDMYRRLTTPRMTAWRVICGILWAVISLGFGIGAIYNIVNADWGEFAFGAVISGLAGWYDYRIWTLKARRLWFII
jgi:hypothetical protein